ncbi:MAG: peptidoglycan DD-metalloendopeptidase family protein [Cryomorphaceae bacterium]|jgi:septal ring factor EnvC (AmiA/AmiB activator)|nr:peptidoglycan DD-metalloendopeptidase family protein [Cryomorphaceae bacterium]
MNPANKILAFLLVLLPVLPVVAQTSDKLKKEQQRLEKKISNTKNLLKKTKTSTVATLNTLKVIDNQIKFREELVYNYDNQVRTAEIRITEKNREIRNLSERIEKLKKQYKKLLLYAYKHRSNYGKMMFIFSAGDYNEARKRSMYLEKIADLQKKQFNIIRQHQHLLGKQITEMSADRNLKAEILEQKKQEKVTIEKDKKKQEEIYNKFRKEEGKLLTQLKDDERKKEVLKQQISAAIKKEIALAEEKKRKAEAAAAAAKKKAEAEKQNSSSSTKETTVKTTPKSETTTEKKETVFTETKESAALSKSFEGNKGKLPWPVDKGSVTEGYGRNAHPTLDNVYTNNNGIDITTPKGASVRAVFDGEVTSILNIPGAGKVVIIKHGNYRTVYSNLQETFVKTGSKVSTKQSIGTLLIKDGESIVHFEIHQVVGSSVQTLNPSLWVTK